MVTLEKFGDSAIKFGFEDNALYLNNGEITVPLNALMLVIDDSQLATFKKLNGDPFVSVSYADLGMDKDELEQWYKDNMVGGTGGSSSGITPSEVQDMIDASISGYDEDIQDEIGEKEQVIAIALTELKNDKADASALTPYFDDAEYVSSAHTIYFYNNGVVKDSIDASDFIVDGMIDDVRIETISGASYLVIDFNTASGKEDIMIPISDIFDASNYYTKAETDSAITASVSGKADTTAVTADIAAAVSGKADNATVTAHTANTAIHVSSNEKYNWNNKLDASAFNTYSAATDARLGEDEEVTAAALNALQDELANKQDVLVAGDNITISGNVISADGGGKAVSAGTNISVTTGETADTINCTLPIEVYNNKRLYIGNNNYYENNYNYGLAFGENNTIRYNYAFLFGKYHSNHGDYNLIFGERNECQGGYNSAIGYGIITRNGYESAFGRYNITNKANNTYGDSGNTLFSIGNGTSTIAKHNAFEIRQNGDIYITLDGQDVKLQDQLGGGSIIIDPTLDSGSTNPVANSAITTAFNNIEDRLGEDEEVTAAALNALNDGINSVNDKFGGLRIVKLTQQEYDALVTKDNNTMYVVV